MYLEIARYFLRLGLLGFGGPLALVAMIQKDLVERERWIPEEEFQQAFSLIKAMPGPVAFMTTVYMGRRRAGFWGGTIAGLCLNLPPFLMMIAFGLFFQSVADLKGTQGFLSGMQVAALGVIVASLKGLVARNWRSVPFWALVGLAALLTWRAPSFEPAVIVGFGLLGIVAARARSGTLPSLALFSAAGLPGGWWLGRDPGAWNELVLVCFKAGALVFGSGLAIVPLLEQDVVVRHAWLNHREFLDALAFGQVTPGPVVITAAYIGFKVAGLLGALGATAAIYAPSFFHIMTWFPHAVRRLSRASWLPHFLFGAVAAVVGSILMTVAKLAIQLEPGWMEGSLAVLVFALMMFTKAPVWALIPAAGTIVALIHG